MTRIYLIRHAEAEGNLYRIAQGQCNSLITDRGYRQIEALSQRFTDIPIDAVYSSDLYRTCVTAGAVYLPKHLPLHKRPGLREIGVGEWEEKTWGEIARDDSEQMINFSVHLDRWHVPGAETPEQVRDRVLQTLQEIVRENPNKTVAVFSHGCAIRILLGTLQGYSIAQLGTTPHGDNTAVSLLEVQDGKITVVFRDDVSHLHKAISTFAKQNWWKRPSALAPGLCFSPLQLPAQTQWLYDCVRDAWADSADSREFNPTLLLQEAQERTTLVAELADELVGLLQFNTNKEEALGRGWISLYCIQKAFRSQGYGIQLLGQAVLYYRPLNRDTLCLALAGDNSEARQFFTSYGFVSTAERTVDGREIWSKDIAFRDL